MPLRSVSFAGGSVRIAWTDSRAGDLVEFLFRDVPEGGADPPLARFEIEVEEVAVREEDVVFSMPKALVD